MLAYPQMAARGRKHGKDKRQTPASARVNEFTAEPRLTRPTLGLAPMWLRILLPVLVAAAAFITFLPALDADFVNWDDDKLFLDNSHYRGLSWPHIQWMFKTTTMGHWEPLTWITLGLDYTLYDMEPRGYHLTNMILHAACAMAVYFLAMRLLRFGIKPGSKASGASIRIAAGLASLFFAVHPLRAESVAWITERRDLLSGLFFILTINAYLKSRMVERYRLLWYLGAMVLFVVSVLSEAWGMTIPAVLIVLDFYPLRRPGSRISTWFSTAGLRVWLEKIPFVIIAALIALKAIAAQQGQLDTAKSLAEHPLLPRTLQVCYGAVFYPWKTLWPFDLIPLYELIQIQKNPWELRFVFAAIGVIVAAVGLFLLRRRWPAGVALVVCYVAIYSPVSGVAQSGPQLVKDSYSYLCCLSWAVMFGGVLVWIYRRWGLRVFVGGACVGVVWVAALGVLSWRQAGVWHDSRTLWAHTLNIDDTCSLAHNNLAILVKQEGKLQEACGHYQRSLEIKPDDANTLFNLANCLKAFKRYDEAIVHYEKALEIRPTHRQARLNLGNTYNTLGNLDGAIEHHRIAARSRSKPELYNLLGYNLHKKAAQLQGDEKQACLDEAEENFRKAIKRKPKYPTALCSLADLLIDSGRCAEAVECLKTVLEVKPNARRPRRLLKKAELKRDGG
ncbi:MAG: tetratricopeptide repeat protein [Phycisphaerae bacterium]|nr:tetratricopeptide repeat protein [Phycisphaerae bacterium]